MLGKHSSTEHRLQISLHFETDPTKLPSMEINIHTEKVPGEDDDRNQGEVSSNQETAKITSKSQKLGEGHGRDSPS